MSQPEVQIRCQRCGTQMDPLNPAPQVRASFLDDLSTTQTTQAGGPNLHRLNSIIEFAKHQHSLDFS